MFKSHYGSPNSTKLPKVSAFLISQVKDLKVLEVEFNPEFVTRVIPKIDWTVLRGAAESVGHLGDLPLQPVPDYENNDEFLRKVHHVLFEIDIINGDLVCPETGRKFPITDGIPNMLLNEDEV